MNPTNVKLIRSLAPRYQAAVEAERREKATFKATPDEPADAWKAAERRYTRLYQKSYRLRDELYAALCDAGIRTITVGKTLFVAVDGSVVADDELPRDVAILPAAGND
jgi:hypothetical protein